MYTDQTRYFNAIIKILIVDNIDNFYQKYAGLYQAQH